MWDRTRSSASTCTLRGWHVDQLRGPTAGPSNLNQTAYTYNLPFLAITPFPENFGSLAKNWRL
jgi:hypothetical protein